MTELGSSWKKKKNKKTPAHLSDAASPGSSFFSSLCSSSSPSRSSRWEVLVVVLVVRDSRVHTVSCNVTEKNRTHVSHTTFLLPALTVWRLIWLARHILVNHILLRAAHLHTVGYKQLNNSITKTSPKGKAGRIYTSMHLMGQSTYFSLVMNQDCSFH